MIPLPSPHPLIRRWEEPHRPLPVRVFRMANRAPVSSPLFASPPWIQTGAWNEPFDFCRHVGRLMEDISLRCADLAHIDVSRVLVGVIQSRNSRNHGLQARVTPLRFADGELLKRRRGMLYQVQRYFHGDREFLYLMSFCLPRFLEQDFDAKLTTVFHEMYHIGPRFNGDLRRHEGRCQIHSRSKRDYDRRMIDLAREYLASQPDPNLHGFLRLSFVQLQERHGGIQGVVVPGPKVVPVAAGSSPDACADTSPPGP